MYHALGHVACSDSKLFSDIMNSFRYLAGSLSRGLVHYEDNKGKQQLTPWKRVCLEKLIVFQLVKNFLP